MKILIVDDVTDYLKALARALPEGHSAVTAASIQEAKQRMDGSIDLALLDVRLSEEDMANRDGIVLLGWIKEAYPNIPVIMMSAYRDHDASVDALNLGASHFLKKPINLRELTDTIASLGKKAQ